ncbi:unnamed protein product [Adineta steineri]|uniref:B box-type domain-containing protein n=1 Tax=Adineta steineri TaxID=433720 RepID=A0A815ML98_9BILA|nr:unnamed protein product [Adineta steineri]CAF1424255.1 unnamed protein product [Adineta steineri]CAF1458167.1 unnamed protein product [Adineta steineri]
MYNNTHLWVFSEAHCPHCSTCEKPNGTYQCIGCGKIFCSRDTGGHRQLLRNELQQFINTCEQWNANSNEELRRRQRILKTGKDSLLTQIDDWEIRSMTLIKQAAIDAREQANKLFQHHTNLLPSRTTLDITMLHRAMETDGFLEPHLKKWNAELHRLKNKIKEFRTDFARIRFVEPFISKLIVDGDFPPNEPPDLSDVDEITNLTESFHLIVPDCRDFDPYNTGELKTGVHRFRYRSNGMFFGIKSKNANSRNSLWNTPSTYGWTGDGLVCLNGNAVRDYDKYENNLGLGDTYLLVVDCDSKILSLTNERLNKTYHLDIDPSVCPLPWQLNVRFLNNIHE